MTYPALEKYLARLNDTVEQDSRVWLDASGRAQGRYFNSTLTSAFQPVRLFGSAQLADASIVAHEGFARSDAQDDGGLQLWRLLDQAASDDESVALDRLCRVLHVVNFYRQAEQPVSLHLSVHARLLTAVDNNHGIAFRRVLNLLELPHEQIVLQMPAVAQKQSWLLNYVIDNYRRNGFKLATSAIDARDALLLLDKLRPDMVKVDARQLGSVEETERLVRQCAARGIELVFKRIEKPQVALQLTQLSQALGMPVQVQGFLWDTPASVLTDENAEPLSKLA